MPDNDNIDFTRLNEADVREEIIAPLIRELGYRSSTEHNVLREQSLRYPRLSLGRKDTRKDPLLRGKADYILEAGGLVRWVIEAKAPTCDIDIDEIEQAWTYANHPEVRAVFFLLCNGRHLMVYQTNLGPASTPILSIGYKQLGNNDTKAILFNLLSPASMLRNHPVHVVDVHPPIGTGLRSIALVTSGHFYYDKSTLPMPALREMQMSIISGAIERDSDNRLVAFLDSQGPSRTIQEFSERLGLSKFEMVSEHPTISTDLENPTTFTYSRSLTFPAGEKLLDMNTWQQMTLPSNIEVGFTVSARGILDGNRFHGTFINNMIIDGMRADLEGRFCLYVA